MDVDAAPFDQDDAVCGTLMRSQHLRRSAEGQSHLMIGSGQCRCRNAVPAAPNRAVDVTVKQVADVAVRVDQPGQPIGIRQATFVERADADVEWRMVQE